MNIISLFLTAAEKNADTLAIVENNQQINYEQLAQDVKRTATYFQTKGIKSGDRVLVFVPMSIKLYRIVLALFHIGATAVFLDEWVSIKRLALCCKLAKCKGFIGVPKARALAIFLKPLRQIPIKLSTSKMAVEEATIRDVHPDDSALITFTTGSTGTPKAVDRTHGFLLEQFKALLIEIDPRASDVDMVTLPIVLFVNLGVGCTSVIADFKMSKPEKTNAAKIKKQLLDQKVTRITASPFFVKKLADYAANTKSNYAEIEKVMTGGAPVFPKEAETYLKAFPNANVRIVYGATEAEPISAISAKTLVNQSSELTLGLPVGLPFENIQIKIIQWQDHPIPPSDEAQLKSMELLDREIGEIIVAGPHVSGRYFSNNDAHLRNKILSEGSSWHRTGDSGFFIGRQLYLTGRCKQLIPIDQQYLSLFLIEHQLQNIASVTLGTLMQIEKQLIVVLETAQEKGQLELVVGDIPHDRLITVHKIPRDPRHNSKIAYDELKLQLERELKKL